MMHKKMSEMTEKELQVRLKEIKREKELSQQTYNYNTNDFVKSTCNILSDMHNSLERVDAFFQAQRQT